MAIINWLRRFISYEEQMRGWLSFVSRATTLQRLVDAYRFLKLQIEQYRKMPLLIFDLRAAAILQELRKRRIRIGTMALRIAAIVLSNDGTLATRNRADFEQVPGLRIEDWTKPV